MKKKASELGEQERMRTLDALYTAAGMVKGRASMKLFLRDLLTESERIMLGRRILIARLLLAGETYEHICARMGTSRGTVANVDRWLHDQLPGYEQALQGMEEEYTRRQEKKLYAESALYRLKKKYPLHFLLFPAPKPKK